MFWLFEKLGYFFANCLVTLISVSWPVWIWYHATLFTFPLISNKSYFDFLLSFLNWSSSTSSKTTWTEWTPTNPRRITPETKWSEIGRLSAPTRGWTDRPNRSQIANPDRNLADPDRNIPDPDPDKVHPVTNLNHGLCSESKIVLVKPSATLQWFVIVIV